MSFVMRNSLNLWYFYVQHELRTPMQGIMGVTGMLLQQNNSKEQSDDNNLVGSLKLIMASSGLLLNLINNLLDVKKFDSESELLTAFCLFMFLVIESKEEI